MGTTKARHVPDETKVFQTTVHPELLKELKIAALRNDMNIPEMLHVILCRGLDRPDLLPRDYDPDA